MPFLRKRRFRGRGIAAHRLYAAQGQEPPMCCGIRATPRCRSVHPAAVL